MAITLAEIKQQVRDRTDQNNSEFIEDAELGRYINQSYKELYDLLVATFEDYYMKSPLEFTVADNENTYDLPEDFYKLRGLDAALSGGPQSEWQTVYPFNFGERNRNDRNINRTIYGIITVSYRVIGDRLEILPSNRASGDYRLWYTPRATDLVADTDVMDGVNGWEEYVIVDACIKVMQKEESDARMFMVQKEQLKTRIESMAMDRDSGSSEKITDVNTYRYYPYNYR